MFFARTNYDKSNRITSVKIKASNEALQLTQKLLGDENSAAQRQRLGEALLDELSDAAQIDIIKLKITDANQYHRKRDGRVILKKYGVYYPKTKLISIANRTAVRGQVLAPKTFLDTLLHEWLHHYDFCRLKINSIHSKGFYLRLKDLKKRLGI